MLAFFLAGLAPVLWTTGIAFVVTFALLVLGEAVDGKRRRPFDRMVRERRRHAERTARAMRRMTEIRHRTAERMDRAEERNWP